MESRNNKILIYSPDVDLCNSISMLLQPEYEIKYLTISLNDVETDTDILIVDVPVSDGGLIKNLERIKSKQPNIKILLLYVYKIYDREKEEMYKAYSDILLYKPIEVNQLIFAVKNLIFKNGTTEFYKNGNGKKISC